MSWIEYRNPQGRRYWYHSVEKRSVWDKPSELKTPRERALEATPWKEYKSGERSYYVHAETKQSTWTLPDELKELLQRYPEEYSPSPIASGSALPARPSAAAAAPRRPSPSPAAVPDIPFVGDGEAAFIGLLEQKGVQPDWTWEQTMRAIITEPLYKALKTIAERKAAFNKHIDSLRAKQAEERRARVDKLSPLVMQAIKKSDRVKPYSSYAAVKKALKGSSAWKQVRNDDEGRAVYDAVFKQLNEEHHAKERETRHRNMDLLMSIFKTFETDTLTRWRDAYRTVLESDEYKQDAHLRHMELADMLIVFDEHMKIVEKDADSAKKRQETQRKRDERKNRDDFKALLAGLPITAQTTWTNVLEKVKDEDVFLRMVGQAGSSPLELFWDVVDEKGQQIQAQHDEVIRKLAENGKEVAEPTTYAEFLEFVDHKPSEQLEAIFEHLHTAAVNDKRRMDRRMRHAIDDLRYAFKKVNDPPLDIEASYQQILPRIQALPEFKDVKDEQARSSAWDKYVKRQFEKAEESRKRRKEEPPAPRKRAKRDDESEEEEGQV